jgi:uncharacterized protein HemX
MDLIIAAIALVVGIGLGASGYRYMLKRNPAKLEQWAAEAKKIGR